MNPQATAASACLNTMVGSQNVICDAQELSAYAVDGMIPKAAARPGTAQEISELVKFAAAENLATIPTGARTKLGIGMPPARYDLAIDMTRLDRVISYDPGDLTLSVEPGIPLARLAETLAEHNQFLPLDVPFFERATVGGTLASGVDSPLRHAYGTPRDFVLGMEFVTGDGALAKSGGRVVKNVTGYDLHKLMLGAIGSLGVITRVNFKTFPRPASRHGFAATFDSLEAALGLRRKIAASAIAPTTLEILNSAMSRLLRHELEGSTPPLDLEWLSTPDWVVAIGLDGIDRVLERSYGQLRRMAQECGATKTLMLGDKERAVVWQGLREAIPLTVESRPACVILRISAIPSLILGVVRLLEFESEHYRVPSAILIRGTGTIYWSILPESAAAAKEKLGACAEVLLPDAAGKREFAATVLICPREWKRQFNIWGASREDFPLMQRVKSAFDPHNIFAPGRFVGGL